MSIVEHFNCFWNLAAINPLSPGQVSLYHTLLFVNNRSYWTEWFTVPNQTLCNMSGLSKNGVLKARNELKQRGLIDFKTRGTQATAYKLLTGSVSVRDGVRDSVRDSVRDGVRDGVRDSVPLIDKDIDKDSFSCSSAEKSDERESNFAKIYGIYPKKTGKAKAYEYYCGWLKGRVINGKKIKLNNRQMWDAVDRYVKQCQENRTELKYYKDFSTFMNKSILDYLEGESDG